MPTRYLKPGVRDSDRIESIVSADAEILYYRLIVTVDDFGRFDARADMIKAACFPIRKRATADKCMQWLQELVSSKLIHIYLVDGKSFLQVLKWDNKPRADASKYPNPRTLTDTCIQLHTDAPLTVTVTETETWVEPPSKSANKKASAIPAGFSLSPEVQAWAEEKGHTDLEKHLEYFVGYAKSSGKKYMDWNQALMNAIRDNWAKVQSPQERRVAL